MPWLAFERGANQPKQSRILLRSIRERLLQPLVVAARRHLENAAHRLDAVAISIGLDELVRRSDTSGDLCFGHGPPPARRLCPLNPGNSTTDVSTIAARGMSANIAFTEEKPIARRALQAGTPRLSDRVLALQPWREISWLLGSLA